jgi:hypothetical protein
MKKTLVARNVTEKLLAAENAVDASIADMSRLMMAMIETRQDLGLPATLTADSFARIGEALSALHQARAAVVAGHHEMARVGEELGIAPSMNIVGYPKVIPARPALETRQVA